MELHLVEPVTSLDVSSFPRLENEELKGAVVKSGSFVYFSVMVKDGESVVVNVKPKAGDVNLFASSLSRFPNETDFEACSVDSFGEKDLKLSGFKGHETEFVIGVVSETPLEFVARLNRLEDAAVSSNSNSDHSVLCGNCQKMIPKASFDLHSVRCPQLVFFCKSCRISLPLSVKSKHDAMMHGQIVCGCGMELQRFQIPAHKRSDSTVSGVPKCPLSPVAW